MSEEVAGDGTPTCVDAPQPSGSSARVYTHTLLGEGLTGMMTSPVACAVGCNSSSTQGSADESGKQELL